MVWKSQQYTLVVSLLILLPQFTPTMTKEECCPCGEGASMLAGVAAVGTVLLAPYALPLVGFTAGGIGAGTLAAKLMSWSWSTGVGSGVVSTLQSAATYTGAHKAAGFAGKAAYTATKNGCCSCE